MQIAFGDPDEVRTAIVDDAVIANVGIIGTFVQNFPRTLHIL